MNTDSSFHDRRPPTRQRRTPWLAAIATAWLVSACGGGGESAQVPAPAPVPVLDLPFAAVGSSARTVSLAWSPAAATGNMLVERRAGNGEFTRVATVDARSGGFLDSGLEAGTTYAYRLAAAGGARSETPARTATTTQEQPVVTPLGTPLGELNGRTLGSAGGQLASPDGRITLNVPAGALAADTATETQPVANTAPDGRGDGLKVRLAAVPSLPLTLTVRYDAVQDDEADALLLAVQRPGGDWTSLPLAAIDKATRTLRAELPPEFVASANKAAAPAVSIEFHIVKYLAFYLAPQQARVKVKQTLELVPYARVRGYDTEIGTCEPLPDGTRACILQPMLEVREMPFTNTKPGYLRSWYVSAELGGNATVGTIAPHASVGASYTAPEKVPSPSQVRVLFHSLHVASQRVVDLIAIVDVWDDAWTGSFTAIDGPSDAGTTLTSTARVRWLPNAGTSTATLKQYVAEGSVDAVVTDDDCTVAITPASAPVGTDVRLVSLEVDESTAPFTYKARLITFWTAQINASCPLAGATVTTQMAGWGWDVQGRVSADGRRIVGEDVTEDGYRLSWSFTR